MTTFADRCASLVDLLDQHAATAEQSRRVSDEVIAAAHDVDLFRAATPTSLGGYSVPFDDFVSGTRIMAHGDVASAWTLSFLVMHGWFISQFPELTLNEVFADGADAPLAPAPLAPTGKIVPTDGGFVLNGRWEWATGINHANWVLVNGVQTEPTFDMKFCLVPADAVDVDDVWFTSGMRATGSNTVVAKDLFVPEHRVLSALSFYEPSERNAGDSYANLPLAPVLAIFAAAPALGGAERAVELYEERLRTRVLAYSLGDKAAEQPVSQSRLAEAKADVQAARDYFECTVARFLAARDAGEMTHEIRSSTRLAAASIVRSARQIVGFVAEGAGASVYMDSHPLQRIQRDIETLKGHAVFDWDRTTELAGRIALGFDVRPTDMV